MSEYRHRTQLNILTESSKKLVRENFQPDRDNNFLIAQLALYYLDIPPWDKYALKIVDALTQTHLKKRKIDVETDAC